MSLVFVQSLELAAASRVYGCLHPEAYSLGVTTTPPRRSLVIGQTALSKCRVYELSHILCENHTKPPFCNNPANQSSAGRERADRTFGGRERVTEQVRRDYTKCFRFCLIYAVKGFYLWRRRASRRILRRSRRALLSWRDWVRLCRFRSWRVCFC